MKAQISFNESDHIISAIVHLQLLKFGFYCMEMADMLRPDENKRWAYFLIDGFEHLKFDFRFILQSNSILAILPTLLSLVLVIGSCVLVFGFLFEEIIEN